ncbi:MAG: zinc ribbon domain-containing protein [Euryarchaeota archaeon]|nr:zinc ribbon domain-containing protein [Euryarchaeota archaeon]
MAKIKLHSISNIALIVGISFYILGGICGWQTITMSSSNSYTSQQQSFAPAGMWATFKSNHTNMSVIFPFPSQYLSQNTTHNPIFTQARTATFTIMWFMFMSTLAIIFAFGIVSALGSRKARTVLSLVIIAMVILELGYFLSAYQAALNEDLENTGFSDMNMFGDKVETASYVLISSIGSGFILTVIAIIAFITALLVECFAYRKRVLQINEKENEKVSVSETTSVNVTYTSTPREHIEKVTIECSQCGRKFEVRVDVTKLPVKVQCPHCGSEIEIG